MHTQTLGLVAMMLHPPSTPSSLLSSSWQHPLRVPAAVVFTLRTTPPTAACSPTCRWTVQPQTFPPPASSPSPRLETMRLAPKSIQVAVGFSKGLADGTRSCFASGERATRGWMWRRRQTRWRREQAAVWAERWAVGRVRAVVFVFASCKSVRNVWLSSPRRATEQSSPPLTHNVFPTQPVTFCGQF